MCGKGEEGGDRFGVSAEGVPVISLTPGASQCSASEAPVPCPLCQAARAMLRPSQERDFPRLVHFTGDAALEVLGQDDLDNPFSSIRALEYLNNSEAHRARAQMIRLAAKESLASMIEKNN